MISALMLLLSTPPMPECNEEAAERGVQQEMNICAHRDFLLADAALNEQWAKTRAVMKERDRVRAENDMDFHTGDDRPGNFDTLLEAQRAWLTYRDAHCRNEGYEARGGSLEPLLVATCKTALTERRTEQLRALTDAY